jgi:hypothetical protein
MLVGLTALTDGIGKINNMGFFGTLGNSFLAGYTAARRVFEDPGLAHQETLYLNQSAMYNLLWAYYNGSMFERIVGSFNGVYSNWGLQANGWAAYKMNYNLYRNIRLIYNPTRRLVDFYAGQVYPGVLSEDGEQLPDGQQLAVPFAKDTPPALKNAVAQFWQWSNWQARKSVQVRYGAALGNVLIEVVDDVEHGNVSAEVIWPGFIDQVQLDAAGNVKSYTLQYQAQEDIAAFIYRKEVDADSFRYFKDGQPYDYGDGQEVENPYGFVPAVWIKHTDIGGPHGSSVIAGTLGKIDELNSLASHVNDQIHKVVGAPIVLWSNGAVTNIFNTLKREPTFEQPNPSADQESVLILKGPQGGHVESLAGNLSLAEADLEIGRLQAEIEQDHPELTFYKELRAMSQVTGPAASRLVGDVNSRFAEAAALYDSGNIKLFQMAVAIGGFRANSGAWGILNSQQQKFTPFNLQSYERGDLDMTIMPRPLLVPTRTEIATENHQFWQGVSFAAQAGVPAEFVLKESGYTDDKIAQLGAAQAQKIKNDQMLATEDKIPTVQQ